MVERRRFEPRPYDGVKSWNLERLVKGITKAQRAAIEGTCPEGKIPEDTNAISRSSLRRINVIDETDHLTAFGLRVREKLGIANCDDVASK